jgi:hypothetical protein
MPFEIIELIYTFIPREIFIIIMAGILYLIYDFLKSKGEKWISQGSKRN